MNPQLSSIVKQASDLWKQLGLNQRVSLVLSALVVIGGMIALGVWASRTDYGLLYGKMDEAEAAKVIAALNDAKVPYRAGASGSVYVPTDKVYAMRMQLASKGIPRAGEGIGFEIFDKPNFGISDFVQRANYVRAVQGELARTIAQLDEIESARVMIVIPENRLLIDNNKRPTASVFVKTKGSGTLPASSVNSIRFLVANAVEGLQANNVSVVDNRGASLTDNNDNDPASGTGSSQLTARRNYEQYLTKNVETMLQAVLGPGQSVARVSAELNFDTTTRMSETFNPDGQVVRISTINDENTDTASANAGGVPGSPTNTNTETNNASSNPLNKSTTKKKIVNNQYEIDRVTSNTVQVAGGLKRVTAAVFVAARMTGSGTNRVATPRSPEELVKLKKIVQSALGIIENDPSRKDEITLEEMPFNDQVGTEITQQFEKQEKYQFWMNLGKQIGYPLLALVVFFVFWRSVKKTAEESIQIGMTESQKEEEARAGGNGSGFPDRRLKNEPGVLTVEVLNQLVRENPDNMSQAIRTWMSKGRTPTTSNPSSN